MAYLFIAIGLALLFAGGEALVRGGVGLSRLLGFSPLVIGLVVISAGTSMPELLVSVRAVMADKPDLAVGNIVGSNIANILFILGLGALIRPIPTAPKVVIRDGGAMLLASLAFVAVAWRGMVTAQIGYWFLGALVLFMLISFASDWRRPITHSVFEARAATRANGHLHPGLSLFFVVIGVALLYFGALFLVDGSIKIAQQFGVSDALVGLTMIALGTSLPELATTIVAAFRGESGLAFGNLIGSNIFNILGVLGTAAIIRPVKIAPMLAHEDALIMAAVALLILPLLYSRWRVTRANGLLFVALYGAYIAFLAYRDGLLPLAALGIG